MAACEGVGRGVLPHVSMSGPCHPLRLNKISSSNTFLLTPPSLRFSTIHRLSKDAHKEAVSKGEQPTIQQGKAGEQVATQCDTTCNPRSLERESTFFYKGA